MTHAASPQPDLNATLAFFKSVIGDISRVTAWHTATLSCFEKILESNRWKVGVRLTSLVSPVSAATGSPEVLESMQQRCLAAEQHAIMAIDKYRYIHNDFARGERELSEFASLVSAVTAAMDDLETTIASQRALYAQLESVMSSLTWRMGDLLVHRIAKRLRGERDRKRAWAPDEAAELNEFVEETYAKFGERRDEFLKTLPEEFRAATESSQSVDLDSFVVGRPYPLKELKPHDGDVTIVVPVYNAPEETKACIESLLRHTAERHRILALNDCSPDEQVRPMLDTFAAEHARVEIVHHPENLGYTANVNFGIERTAGDVVMLNSDTVVTPRWLEKLSTTAYSREKVATVTPLTNSGSAFSVPVINQANELSEGISVNTMGDILERVSHWLRPEVPTGNGFCMYMRRDAIDAIGVFDAEAFPSGYGEENDFCQRAFAAGYVNLIDDATFIYHAESASFLDSKAAIVEESLRNVNEMHPGYADTIQRWLQHDELGPLRRVLELILSGRQPMPAESYWQAHDEPVVLFVVHQGKGGTIHHVNDLTRSCASQFRCIQLHAGEKSWRLLYESGRGLVPFLTIPFERQWVLAEPMDAERMEAWQRVVREFSVSTVHFHHLIGTGPEMITWCRDHDLRTVFSFHDFYALCPSFNLLDENDVYCGGRCTESPGPCDARIDWVETPTLKDAYVHEWRARVLPALKQCSTLVTFSEFTKTLIREHFPTLPEERFRVIPHGQDVKEFEKAYRTAAEGEPIRIVLVGALGPSKGIGVVSRLTELNQERGGPFEFHFVGALHPDFRPKGPGVVMHGSYLAEYLPEILRGIRPNFAIIASIWPETFCFTLSESWAAGIPVFVSDLGTIRERVLENGGGWLLNPANPETWYEIMLETAGNPEEVRARMKEVEAMSIKDVSVMAEEYRHLYEELADAAETG